MVSPTTTLPPLALFPHRAHYVSDVEGFAAFGRKLYRAVGCIPTRRFTSNLPLVRNIDALIKKREIVVIFPEARHSNVGTNSEIPLSVGKLVRHLKVPVVILKMNGSYLESPIWDEERSRQAPLEARLEKILEPESYATMSPEEITTLLNAHFSYDEYRWQRDRGISIASEHRAEGLHTMLYRCPQCTAEYRMTSHGTELKCSSCGQVWHMDEWGNLISHQHAQAHSPLLITDWYEAQRRVLHEEIAQGSYDLDIEVKIEALPNHKGFIPLGTGRLHHDIKGFTLVFNETKDELSVPTASLPSVHTECNYRGKGDCLVLSTPRCCYYLYATKEPLPMTKVQFATEEFYRLWTRARDARRPYSI